MPTNRTRRARDRLYKRGLALRAKGLEGSDEFKDLCTGSISNFI
jgi:hypothetical protein